MLVRVRAASVNAADWHVMRGLPYVIRAMGARMGFGLRGAENGVLGLNLAGDGRSGREERHELRPGDAVYGECSGVVRRYACAPKAPWRRCPPA